MLRSNWSSPIPHHSLPPSHSLSILRFQRKFVSSKCGFPHDTHSVLWSLPLWTRVSYLPLHVPHQLWLPIFTTSSPFSFNHVPLSLTSQLITHERYISLSYMVFECRHNILNQSVSTTIPSPTSFRNIITISKHQHFGKILKYVFSYVFQGSIAYR